ncbi:MAG: LPS export ABC transporter ATP-binding protein, partial [Bacteroidales bacterium]|nr:LPS export ABC transporter ATP-binding protein [Bacteroidales bacterium]
MSQATEPTDAAEPECMELRSEGLVKIYGKRTVVNNVSFNVRQGEIVGL